MNQETVTSLIGVLVIVVIVAVAIFILRATYRTILDVIRSRAILTKRKLHKIGVQFAMEQDRITQEVQPKFELWWLQSGRVLPDNGRKDLDNLIALVTTFDISSLAEVIQSQKEKDDSEIAYREVFEYAVHLACSAIQKNHIDSIRSINKGLADHIVAVHEEHLAEHRKFLIEVDIDLDELEREFTSV